MNHAVIRDVRWPGGAERFDVWIADGTVAAIMPHRSLPVAELLASVPEGVTVPADAVVTVWQGGGGVLMRGLWDEHTHFRQWALSRRRLDLSSADSAADAVQRVAEAVRDRSGPVTARLDGAGFRDALWPDEPSTAALDAVSSETPIVLVSADLHCGWMNRAGLRAMGLPEDAAGPVREDDWIPHLDRLALEDGFTVPALAEAAAAAARRGVVGVVDMETDDNLLRWPERVAGGVSSLRVEAAVWSHQLAGAVDAGRRSGEVLPGTGGLVTVGPMKVIVDGSLNTRTAFCFEDYAGEHTDQDHPSGYLALDEPALAELLDTALGAGFVPAVHAIGDRANRLVLDAFAAQRERGHDVRGARVEHAQLLTVDDVPRFAELGIVASVQPEHAMDDRDVSDRYWPGQAVRSFPLRALLDAGAVLRFGSDAPVAPLDPWVAIAAAVTRARDGRAPWAPEQRITRAEALTAACRGRSEVRRGDVADLVLLGDDPLVCSDETLREMPVLLTLLAGRATWAENPGSTVPAAQS